jgi:hypothetical protein
MKGNKKMNDIEKQQLKQNDLINDVDRAFYDIENIEDQATIFRLILKQLKYSKLIALKQIIKNDLKGGK